MKVKDMGFPIEIRDRLKDVYLIKIGRIRYLISINFKKNCCQICGKKRKTTAHHLVPKRLHCICPFLAEVRVRVCSGCDEDFHPENKFIKESEIVKRQSKYILDLKETIREKDKEIRILVKSGIINSGKKEVSKNDK